MKSTIKNKKTTFVVGKTLPDILPKAARDYFVSAITPRKALEIAARVRSIESKYISAQNAC